MPEFLTVAKVGDIPEGEGRAFECNDQIIAVFNDGGEYHAIDDMCPHMGASLASGHLDDCIVTCPWHAWSFDTRDGTWCDNPRLRIDVFDVRVVGQEIQVAPVERKPQQSGAPTTEKSTPSDMPSSSNPSPIHPAEGENE